MKTLLLLTTLGLIMRINVLAQSRLDSLINLRKTEKLEGKLPTYYTPGYRDVALDFQSLITEAMKYYEAQYPVQFNVKLLVLDSSQWIREAIPYGFVILSRGWIVMNTGMSFNTFKKIYKVESYAQQLENEAKNLNIPTAAIASSLFKFFSIHELGHSFMGQLSKPPDNWTGEFSASYFSYQFFHHTNRGNDLKPYELFSRINKDNYEPKYSTIADFNEKYTRTGLENYAWYHSNFYFLVQDLYECQGKEFLPAFHKEFSKDSNRRFSIDETIGILDKNCNGLVRQWVTNMENKSKK